MVATATRERGGEDGRWEGESKTRGEAGRQAGRDEEREGKRMIGDRAKWVTEAGREGRLRGEGRNGKSKTRGGDESV